MITRFTREVVSEGKKNNSDARYSKMRDKMLKTTRLPPSPLMPQSLDGYEKPRPMRQSRADVTCMHPPPYNSVVLKIFCDSGWVVLTPPVLSLSYFPFLDRSCLGLEDREKHFDVLVLVLLEEEFARTSWFLPSSSLWVSLSLAGTASRSEGKYCKRRIRVEDDDALVTNFTLQDRRQFHRDIALS